jgi:hypothetical protein
LASGDEPIVHLFARPNGQPLVADLYSGAVKKAFEHFVGEPLVPQTLGQLYVDHHVAAGTLPAGVAAAMGRSITPSVPLDATSKRAVSP